MQNNLTMKKQESNAKENYKRNQRKISGFDNH